MIKAAERLDEVDGNAFGEERPLAARHAHRGAVAPEEDRGRSGHAVFPRGEETAFRPTRTTTTTTTSSSAPVP